MITPVGTFAWPNDIPGSIALCLAILCLFWALVPTSRAPRFLSIPPRPLLWVLATLSGVLSLGYVFYYLKGGPRIIDATSYFLEARGFAEGRLDLPLPGPSGSFRGRFLLNPTLGSAPPNLGVLFPPGYPLLLSLGFLCHVPMLIGPILAIGLVLATYKLTLDLFQDSKIALLSAFLSTCCATLRYHTSDTMSHGWAALLFVLALIFARKPQWHAALASGAFCGLLCATRPITGIVAIGVVAGVHITTRFDAVRPIRRGLWIAAGTLPGIALLLLHQKATTGSFLESSQLRYYALADGPPGCFHFGFGASVGCKHEHGEFAKLYLPNGYGLLEAIHTTGRRLVMHLRDAANFEPMLLAIPIGLLRRPYKAGAGLLAGAILGLILAYAGFYYDGNYPGGGARMFADVLPLEQALLAWSLTKLGLERFTPALVLAGFALHTSHDQRQLAARDGGHPLFEPHVVTDAGVAHGLIFVSTDHGFNLGFDPNANVKTGIVVARLRGDGHDVALWKALGSPATYRYDLDPYGPNPTPRLLPYEMTTLNPQRFEAEAEWPPLEVIRGWVEPRASSCNDSRRGLALIPTDGAMSTTIELPFAEDGRYRLLMTWQSERAAHVDVALRKLDGKGEPWLNEGLQVASGCTVVTTSELGATSGSTRLTLSTRDPVLLDRIELLRGVSQSSR